MMYIKRALLFFLVGSLLLNGCTSWRTLESVTVPGDYGDVRLVMMDGRMIEMKSVKTAGDSLSGLSSRTVLDWRKEVDTFDVPMVVPLGDIRSMETRQTDAGKTVALGLATATVLFVAAFVVAFAVSDDNWGGF